MIIAIRVGAMTRPFSQDRLTVAEDGDSGSTDRNVSRDMGYTPPDYKSRSLPFLDGPDVNR